ncbi:MULTISPECIES: multicopper oxidase domain-containing protein [unclassified Dyella]|uniref:multicopper oxidase family protein n=2 Tax=Dyella TaxID=231454 RepID=UPI000CC70761|nr:MULTISPECIES: multicopper oxidase domain-containing protein [unclassified Dyella]MDR3444062.1 multicopper oxidase domain-containing protein [Dyella sp.]PMQ06322.1 Spore coat protein A [Dyella sp. AD56]
MTRINPSRRQFLRGLFDMVGAATAAELGLLAWSAPAIGDEKMARMAMPQLAAPNVPLVNPVTLARFVDPLPLPAVAKPVGQRSDPTHPGKQLPLYRMEMRAFKAQLHRDLPPTPLWGYNGSFPGPTLVARRNEPLLIEWANALPKKHFLPIDHTIHGAERSKPEVRTVTHVHGARVSPSSDGYPEEWFEPGRSAVSHYPNAQDAATLWYHDHAMGITRLNIYAGLLGAYLIEDDAEKALNLPTGDCDLPLILCDRLIAKDGQLYYPVSDDPDAPWVSECNGNAILCNGKLFPFTEVEPRRYRLRLINAANTRFYELSLSNGLAFTQIASDQGLLAAPLTRSHVTLYPAERADVIVDFSGMDGKQAQLRQQGDAIMEFRVRDRGRKDTSAVPATLRTIERMAEASAVRDRVLTLGEQDDAGGSPMMMMLGGKHWSAPITEDPRQNTTEIWSMVNLTGDAHPMHLHLVRFQVLERRPFDLFVWNESKTLKYTGPAIPPAPEEMGWKDTVRADPGMVTRIIAKFEGEPGRYVWHCHLLEHEDNEMMRPFQLLPA